MDLIQLAHFTGDKTETQKKGKAKIQNIYQKLYMFILFKIINL